MKVKQILGVIGFTLKKYSPEILMVVGMGGTVVGTVMACKATLKCEQLLDEHAEKMEKFNECKELADKRELKWEPKEQTKDLILIKRDTAIGFVKLYWPSATIMVASFACILGGHKIMNKRNAALMAAYKVVEEAFGNYRKRVADELGVEKDAHFLYGTDTIEEVETVVDENGKKKKIKKEREELVPGVKLSGFARILEPDKPDQYGSWTGSTQWCPHHEYNLSMLYQKEAWFNDQLVVKGFVTMNDVYDELGFARTDAGMIAGWRYKSNRGDGYISFRPKGIDGNWEYGKDGDSIILDFNIDGVIFDSEAVKREME